MYPADDLAALAVDEMMDVCQDILTKCPQEKDEEVKKAKRQEYAAGKMKSLFELVAQRAEESGSGWLCGSDMTIAGLCVCGCGGVCTCVCVCVCISLCFRARGLLRWQCRPRHPLMPCALPCQIFASTLFWQ